MAVIPHMQTISEKINRSGKINRLLTRYNIMTINQLVKKSNNLLQSTKDNLRCNVPGIYCILCRCGKMNAEQTGCTITARCKEHEHHNDYTNQTNLLKQNTALNSVTTLALVR
jgi:hypothetical protein